MARKSAREHRGALELAADQREPAHEARKRRKDEEVTEVLVPAHPHVVAAEEAARQRRAARSAN